MSPWKLDSIARALGHHVSTSGRRFLCQCPVASHGKGHGDQSPSLSIWQGNDGGLAVHCFGGCDAHDVYAALRGCGLIEDRSGRRQGRPLRVVPIAKPSVANDNLKRALDIWAGSQDAHATPAEVYLAARMLALPCGADVIRFHPHCPFGQDRCACMVALFRDNLTDAPCGIQRTRLPLQGWRRGTKMQRMNLGPTGSGSIKIDEDAAVAYGLVVAEGLETALAGSALGYAPAWVTGGKGTLKRFPVLPVVQHLSIHWEADADADATACVDRWRREGRGVDILQSLFGEDAADALWEGA